MAPGPTTGGGLGCLRARSGIPEPNPQPPHYAPPNEDAFRHVAEAYGDDNPLWCDPAYGPSTRWGGVIASPALVGADTLIGLHEVPDAPADHRDPMNADPLPALHPFSSPP